SPDGRKLYLYRSNTNSGDIFESAKEGDTWTIPTPLKGNVNTQYQETSASFSPDGGVLYFVSNRLDDNKGGKDIYIAYKNDNNVWEKVENLGPVVNSPYDEEGVFMHPDGRTLYFSSKGHNTMGGFDIFKTVRDTNGIWSKPVNIGYPVNTPENDVFLVMSSSGDHGYFSSYKEGGLGEQDIYKVVFLKNEETNDTISTDTKVTIVSGQVTDPETDQPLEANIEVVDNDEGKVVSETKSDAKTGKYLVALPSGKDYGVTVESDGYLFQSENFNIPDSAAYSEVKKDIKVPKVQEGANIILKNIFFEYFSSRLSKKSTGELNRILKVLNRYPQMKIEISGHTDNIGPEDGNRRLSQARAKAVSDYLVSNGIDKDRLVTKGHGSTQPIADNSTPQGQSENRRVEFRILSK
ncbi:MAG: OmpA family protein, partial [Bacteroidetes bacterium]|nr:OmpA family protein [Bacteroidota bacterium]